MYFSLFIFFVFPFENKQIKPFKPDNNFVFIPMGTLQTETTNASVNAFYMAKHEVTNLQYRIFLGDLKRQGKIDEYIIALPDSTQWRDSLAYNEPMVEFYFRHPAYENYPVVNITHEGALLYCKWLGDQYSNAEYKVKFRLPSREEWMWAAQGGMQNTVYPWGGPYLRDSKGCNMCNYKSYGSEHVHYNEKEKKYVIAITNNNDQAFYFFPCVVGHYKENGYNLFDMSGNVAEMIAEKGIALGGSWNSTGWDVRIESSISYSGPNPYVGFRPVLSSIQ